MPAREGVGKEEVGGAGEKRICADLTEGIRKGRNKPMTRNRKIGSERTWAKKRGTKALEKSINHTIQGGQIQKTTLK